MTVSGILRRMMAKRDLVDKRRVRSFKVNNAIVNELIDQKKLQEWSSMTLSARCLRIERDYGIRISVFCLRSLYKRNGIAFRNTQVVHRQAFERKDGLDQ